MNGGHTLIETDRTSPVDVMPETSKRERGNYVYHHSIRIGVILMQATDGQPITINNLWALQFRGYLDFGTDEILDIFYSTDDYNDVVRSHYQEELEQQLQKDLAQPLQSHLNTVHKAATDPIMASLDEKELVFELDTGDIYFDRRKKRLLVGQVAVSHLVEKGRGPESIVPLAKLLTSDSIPKRTSKRQEHTDYKRGDIVRYGKFLLRVMSEAGHKLEGSAITNAYRLGLGPGPNGIRTNPDGFKSLADFYLEINAASSVIRGMFDNWTVDDFATHLKVVAVEEGGEVTEERLKQRVFEDRKIEPTPHVIRAHTGMTVGELKKLAGLKSHNTRKVDVNSIIRPGVAFYEKYKRLPSKPEILKDESFPSWTPIKRMCDTLPNYHSLILANLDEELAA